MMDDDFSRDAQPLKRPRLKTDDNELLQPKDGLELSPPYFIGAGESGRDPHILF